jgi:hypothetical protein
MKYVAQLKDEQWRIIGVYSTEPLAEKTEGVEWFKEYQAFSPFGSSPTPPFLLSISKLSLFFQSSSMSPVELTDSRGGGAKSYVIEKA